MIKVALIGAGKMGISHLSILGAHPDVEVVGVCDNSKLVLDVLKKYSPFPCFSDMDEMLDKANPEAVVVALPTKFHVPVVMKLLNQGRHVFVEKPLSLSSDEGKEIVQLAQQKGVVNQVGYHNRFIETFREVKSIVENGYMGQLFHFVGESYGPVVIKAKQDNWRADPKEGGGCLMDYASHVIDLIGFILGPISKIDGGLLKSFYSRQVEDAVISLVELDSKLTGLLNVNWSDETYRKMSTSITIFGSNGKIISNANELKVYFKTDDCPKGYEKGWNIKYITDFPTDVDFYLRGEEYSNQMDYFIKAVQGKIVNTTNTFQTAWNADKVISLIRSNAN
jgi:predicted dehydrogenase